LSEHLFLLQELLRYCRGLDAAEHAALRFHHVSTDEVFGSLPNDGLFTDLSP
jgi:dTDP-glucose 4,6-dehydratase